MERVCMSRHLQEVLRTCRRRNISVSYGGLVVHGLRNYCRSPHALHGDAYKHCQSMGNPRQKMGTYSALFEKHLWKADTRTMLGGHVYQIQNISTSAKRINSEKGSEKGSEKDSKRYGGKDKIEDLFNLQMQLGAVAGLGILASLILMYSRLPVLDTSQELKSILLNNEIERIIIVHKFPLCQHVTFEGKDEHQMREGHIYRIRSKNRFLHNLKKTYEEMEIDPSERLETKVVDNRIQYTALIGLLLMPVLMRKTGLMGNISKPGRNIAKKTQQTTAHPKAEKTMVDMLLGDRANAGYVRGDILSKQGNGVTFKEVAGLKEAKYEVMEFVDYLKSSENVRKLGGKHPRGVLLLGPPGCGKTLLAKAVATEAGVPFFALAGSQFVEMLGGLGASRMRNLFKEARQQAPCIIYVDEIDAIGKKRKGSAADSEEEHTLNQLLVELDGMGTTEGIIMIASTNRSDVLDKALMRPGRFDRQIQIDFPTVDEREEIFHVYMKKLKMTADYKELAPRLAQLTTGMSGADIANICNEAALHAARHANDHVTMGDFYFAIERIVAGAEKKRSVITQEDRKVVAYHEAGHALVGWLLQHSDALLQVSIVPRTNNILGFAQLAPKDNYLYSNQQLFDKMCMMLGGRAAESITFNHVTSGAQDDLDKVTKQAYTQIRSWGMNDRLGCVSFDYSEKSPLLPYSKSLSNIMDEEVKKLVVKAYLATQNLLMENRAKLELLASTLLEKESLTYDEVRDLIGPPPHGDKIKVETRQIMSDAAKEAKSQSKTTND
ncbi:paraplegin-like isoform X2 [Mizuhopecten yessoensis]|uniref:paraplegin-like isoform X2 n=1 Tax=Mizuhopecten yessoensis TaxID=6573 RepID=UPI000B45F2DA|nr:paraplegin-like isoform X2 [Mizuhopecten yessoensis]